MNDLPKTARADNADNAKASWASLSVSEPPPIPGYITKTYAWAYINPLGVALLDRPLAVSLILWGNQKKLMAEAMKEFRAGQRVLQAAHVYGDFTPELARTVGPLGKLEVIDVTPIQVERCRQKLSGLAQAKVRLANAAAPGRGEPSKDEPGKGGYDAVSCYFLLHETPDDYRRLIVNALLAMVGPGGKAVFVDYHKPRASHPLKWFMYFIFKTLEPYAIGLLQGEIMDFASDHAAFSWRKQTYFGGLYQKVVAERRFR